ncbi:MAG: phosphatase PAP2 family protein [Candidatus Diapherotrites archaeon]|uniref:Phosphatase PAP2 family protein n=1 Tax=Candidatus Iainarchaeum sp. TaxID=3101447 RepID=A0A8T3YM83_9ARCH|nr:phosphatase PAP2 family protein [Candidatus Diapherotrites archaeon]
MLEPTQPEIAFSHFVQSFASQPLDIFFQIVTMLGHPAVWLAVAAFLYWKGEEKKSFFIAANILFAAAVVGILKSVTGRPRPSPAEFMVIGAESDSNLSFPSGHTTTISAMLGYYWKTISRNIMVMWFAAIALVMLSRVYLGQHYIGDVVVGSMFGIVIGNVTGFLESKYSGIKFNGRRVLEEAGLAIAIIAAVVIAVFLSSLSFAGVLFGYFAGACTYKLLNMDSERPNGKRLAAKEAIGFGGAGAIALGTAMPAIGTISYFALGLWISLIYPALWEKLAPK